jgi:hypothetical protein
MMNKSDSNNFYEQQPSRHMTEGPAPECPPFQSGKKYKVKGGLLLKDWGQTEATTEEVEKTILRVTKLSTQGRARAGHLSKQLHDFSLDRTIVGKKEEQSQSIEKPENTIGSLALQADLLRYDHLTNSNHLTTPNMMAKPNPSNGSESTLSQSN